MAKYFALFLSVAFLGLIVLAIFGFSAITGTPLLSMTQHPPRSITVDAQAKGKLENQSARFNATVLATNEDKDAAVAEVEQKTDELITLLIQFGIPQDQIQTQFFNIYQPEDINFNNEAVVRTGPWRVSNSLSIKLTDIARAEELTSLLVSSGATDVTGPNFTVDDVEDLETQLFSEAIKNARTKAEKIATENGMSVGKVISISESGVSGISPMYSMRDMGGGGGIPLEPGAQDISKTVSVTFQLQ